jgi:histone H3/H4
MTRVKQNPKKTVRSDEEQEDTRKTSSKKRQHEEEEPVAEEVVNEEPVVKKRKHGKRSSEVKGVLADIKKYQANNKTLIPRAPFSRLVREIAQDFQTDLRFSHAAIDVIHWWGDIFLAELLYKANEMPFNRRRKTLTVEDLQVVLITDSKYANIAPTYIARVKKERFKAKEDEIQKDLIKARVRKQKMLLKANETQKLLRNIRTESQKLL